MTSETARDDLQALLAVGTPISTLTLYAPRNGHERELATLVATAKHVTISKACISDGVSQL